MLPAKIPFTGHILMLGFGGVAKCTLPLLLQNLGISPKQITVMDMVDNREYLADLIAQGLTFRQERLTRELMGPQLFSILKRGDLLVDLAWNIACTDLLNWCHRNGALYINTSVELWDPYEGREHFHPCEQTLYVRHMAIRALMHSWKDKPGPTAVLEHGANPGLVSHFAKKALLDIGERLISEKMHDPRREAINHAMRYGNFAELTALLNVQTIHISEIDTQIAHTPHDPHTFLNTWSVEGFREEGTAPAEMGWGTHERTMPEDGCAHISGPRNQICLKRFGIDTRVKSRVPSQEIVGMIVRHGEAFTLSDALTTWNDDGTPAHRPTVHYAYCPCAEALRSFEDLCARNFAAPDKWRILGDDIQSGIDELGVLLMGHDFKAWWMGTILSIDEARRLVPGQNATTLQVAASVMAAVRWMIRHPNEGVRIPDQLPHREILEAAAPYLGSLPSIPIDWTPTGRPVDASTWQFGSFLTDEKPHGKVFRPVLH
ncbi:MAG: saccharopine dehydrogenase C-terminal domain-containing protein [Candidatus Peribacteraceae bacterium]|jgi:homospermidine synthase|nr:saccharopine dehydrogenase C-terminal domain-containing protein [Candidatus Peribacteraceae bacterium]